MKFLLTNFTKKEYVKFEYETIIDLISDKKHLDTIATLVSDGTWANSKISFICENAPAADSRNQHHDALYLRIEALNSGYITFDEDAKMISRDERFYDYLAEEFTEITPEITTFESFWMKNTDSNLMLSFYRTVHKGLEFIPDTEGKIIKMNASDFYPTILEFMAGYYEENNAFNVEALSNSDILMNFDKFEKCEDESSHLILRHYDFVASGVDDISSIMQSLKTLGEQYPETLEYKLDTDTQDLIKELHPYAHLA